MSGLRVNFHKSRVIRIKTSNNFLDVATKFFSCRIEDKSFSFLGIHDDANPRRISMGDPLLGNIKDKLAFWKGRILSIGGRITLLKSVICSLSIFWFYFFKGPAKIWKEIEKIQQSFSWGTKENKRVIHWVGWDTICRLVKLGGLRVKRIK